MKQLVRFLVVGIFMFSALTTTTALGAPSGGTTTGKTTSSGLLGQVRFGKYFAMPGDTIFTIMRKFPHVSEQGLLKMNPWITHANQNLSGRIVILPSM